MAVGEIHGAEQARAGAENLGLDGGDLGVSVVSTGRRKWRWCSLSYWIFVCAHVQTACLVDFNGCRVLKIKGNGLLQYPAGLSIFQGCLCIIQGILECV